MAVQIQSVRVREGKLNTKHLMKTRRDIERGSLYLDSII